MTSTCKTCGKEIGFRLKPTEFCSLRCSRPPDQKPVRVRKAKISPPRHSHVCVQCHVKFINSRLKGKFCSKRCSRKHSKNGKPRGSVLRRRTFLLAHKQLAGCSRCGEKRPACLHFHHIDPKTKNPILKAKRAQGGRTREMARLTRGDLLTEMKKCIVLCANCHSIEEWGDGMVGNPEEIVSKYLSVPTQQANLSTTQQANSNTRPAPQTALPAI